MHTCPLMFSSRGAAHRLLFVRRLQSLGILSFEFFIRPTVDSGCVTEACPGAKTLLHAKAMKNILMKQVLNGGGSANEAYLPARVALNAFDS